MDYKQKRRLCFILEELQSRDFELRVIRWLHCQNYFAKGPSGVVQSAQVHGVYPLISQTAPSIPTSKWPLILSAANQLLC